MTSTATNMQINTESKSPILKAAWDKFHASMELARQEVEKAPRFAHPDNRAQAYYALIEAQAMAYNWVLAPRLNHPRIFIHTSFATYLYTIGGNCPDIVYSVVALDGRHTYRIRGRHGDVRLLLMQVFNKPVGVEGWRCTGNYAYSRHDDGNDQVEVVLSATPHEGNWVPLDPDSGFNMILMRRFLLDWNEDPGELDIEMQGELADYDELDEVQMAQRISMAADFNLAVIKMWGIGFLDLTLQLAGGKCNVWGGAPGEQLGNYAGSASCNYAFMAYELQPDEAIIVEMEPPAASAYWSFQLVDVWNKSLDFMHRQTDINMKRATIDADGRMRAVICFEDPGIANWLDPMGRAQGICALRNYRSATFTTPSARVVKFAELMQHLPSDTRRVTPEQRRDAIAARRKGLLRLYRG